MLTQVKAQLLAIQRKSDDSVGGETKGEDSIFQSEFTVPSSRAPHLYSATPMFSHLSRTIILQKDFSSPKNTVLNRHEHNAHSFMPLKCKETVAVNTDRYVVNIASTST